MSVSPNGRLLALFTAERLLHVISTDFQKNFSVFATKSRNKLNQLVWCARVVLLTSRCNERRV